MKILFVTGNLELGKDGVGDYTIMMAKTCMEAGCHCAIIALNDVYLNVDSVTDNFDKIPFLRLRSSLNWSGKKALAKAFANNFDPEFVSIQMVCYAFQPRGWIFGLGKKIKSLFSNSVRFEVNLHEVWLGFSINHNLKARLNGILQKRTLLLFLNELNPIKIHVGNNVYFSLLNAIGYQVQYLPLPSNIPIKEKPNLEWIKDEFHLVDKSNCLVFIFFGSIQGNWDVKAFWNKILSLTEKKRVCAISVGKQGFGHVLWDEMVSEFKHQIDFKKLGFKTNSEISDLLHFSDFGIATTPMSLLGKSGSAMAMIEHGLPVIVTRDELKYNYEIKKVENTYPAVVLWEAVQGLDHFPKTGLLRSRTTEIANLFLNNLKQNEAIWKPLVLN